MKVKVKDLENETIIDRAIFIAESFYELADSLPIEEKHMISSRFRFACLDIVFYIAQGVGGEGGITEHDWISVKKNLLGLKSVYRLAGKQGVVNIDPDLMVKIDSLYDETDENLKLSREVVKDLRKEDLEPWLEKYKLWKEMQ